MRQLSILASVARTQPHATYAAFRHAFVGRLIFLSKTCGGLQLFLPPLEKTIRTLFLPSLTGRPAPGDEVRTLLALPPRSGGLGVLNPVTALADEHARLIYVCTPLTECIQQQVHSLGDVCVEIQ